MKKSWIVAIFAAVLLLEAFASSNAQAPINVKWEVIREASSRTNYANLVILSEAFPAGDQLEKKFPGYAKEVNDSLMVHARRNRWDDWGRIRVILAYVASRDSGMSVPLKGIVTDTYFGSSFPGGSSQVNLSNEGFRKVAQILSSVPGGYDPEKDLALMIVNAEIFGGTFWEFDRYKLAITTSPKGFPGFTFTITAAHELGHNWLEDEHPIAASRFDIYFRDYANFNVMKVPKLSSLPLQDINWWELIPPNTPIPTDRVKEVIGDLTFYFGKGVGFYRLREEKSDEQYFIGYVGCIMNGGNDRKPHFCPVCQLGIRRGLQKMFFLLAADFNEDGVVDFADFFLFAEGFGKKKGEAGFNSRYDLDGNGEVSFEDFFRFAESFGKKKGLRNPVPVASKPIVISPVNLCGGQHNVGEVP